MPSRTRSTTWPPYANNTGPPHPPASPTTQNHAIATTNLTDIEPLPDLGTPATRPPRIDLKRWAEEFRDVYRIAEALCKTPFVPKEMIGRQADVAAAIMKGQELGLDPFDALGSIYIVHGRVGFYADFMRRRIVQAGHTLTIGIHRNPVCHRRRPQRHRPETPRPVHRRPSPPRRHRPRQIPRRQADRPRHQPAMHPSLSRRPVWDADRRRPHRRCHPPRAHRRPRQERWRGRGAAGATQTRHQTPQSRTHPTQTNTNPHQSRRR